MEKRRQFLLFSTIFLHVVNWRYSRKAKITKHRRKRRWEIYNDKTNAAYETTDAKTNCNRGITLERLNDQKKNDRGVVETSPLMLMQLQITSLCSVRTLSMKRHYEAQLFTNTMRKQRKGLMCFVILAFLEYLQLYSWLPLSRPRLSRITAYLEMKILSLLKHENLITCKNIVDFLWSDLRHRRKRDEKYTRTKQTQHMKPPTQRRIATEESPWSAWTIRRKIL